MIKKLLLFAVFTIFINVNLFGQCTNTEYNGSTPAPPVPYYFIIDNCQLQGEYATIFDIVAGETYEANNTEGGYITVRSGAPGGPVVGHGYAPFTFTATANGNHFIHFNRTATCFLTGEDVCGTSTIGNITPPPPPPECGDTFYDSGGAGGAYSNGENISTTVTPNTPNTFSVVTFTAFEIEYDYDFLYIYDGPNNTFPLIGIPYTGTNSPGTVTSSHPSGALTFVFESDRTVTQEGWAADVTCVCWTITDTNYPLGTNESNLDYIELTTNASLPQVTWSPTTDLYTDSSLTTPYTGGFAGTVYAAPNGTQTYTATDASSCADMVTVIYNKKRWNGFVDNNWYDNSNWTPNGVPSSTSWVVIPDPTQSNGNSPVLDMMNLTPLPPQPSFAKNLTIQNGGYLEIEENTSIEVLEFVNIAPNGTLLLRDSASLIQVTEGTANTNNNTGAIHMQRSVTGLNTYDYVYWSSPVENFNVAQISPNTNANAIWKWLPTQAGGGGIGNHGDWRNATTNEAMIVGQGYIVRDLGGATVIPPALPANTTEFIGRPNNGIITFSISRGTHTTAAGNYTGESGIINATTPQDDNWNLVGNPYPSAISYGDFINANNTIDGTIHLWTHQFAPTAIPSPFYQDFGFNYSDDYIDNNYSGSNPPGFNGNIAAGQSFFVQMLETTPSTTEDLIFNNGMRSPSNDNSQFYRQASSASQQNYTSIERHRIWLDLLTSDNIATSTLVGYIEGATNQKDRLYDGYDFEGTSVSFYSLIADEKMAIQGRALPFLDSDIVPMGMILQQSGMFTIAINSIDGLFATPNQAIYIEDTYSNTIHNLRTMPYTFTSESGTFNDRFILRYRDSALGIDEFKALNLNITAPNGDYIKITSDNNPIKSIQVYDLLGRVLLDKTNVNTINFIIENDNLSEGTYIVKATLENNKFKIQKIILKQ